LKLLYAIIVGSVLFLTPLYGNDWAHGGFMPDRHRGSVNAIIHNGNTILSAGKDGFLELWDANGGQAVQRFQISPYSIIAMAHKPGSEEICIVENEGLGQYRISAWNYRRREKIFTVRFTDPIDYIGYSGGGNFILAARTGRTALIFIDAATGNTLQSPQSLAGTVGLAVTGRSERNMMTYLTSGVLSYWDLESGNETSRFNVPANLSSPALFANNRYLAGINRQGLSVVNAVSGELVATDNSIPNGSMLCSAGDDFSCLVQRNKTAELSRYTVDRDGRLVTLGHFVLSSTALDSAAPSGTDRIITAIAANGTTALGTVSGFIILANPDGQERILSTKDRLYITDAAVANESIAFITEGSLTGIIPLDYGRFQDGNTITLEQTGAAYNRITVFSDTDGGQFIFWQDQNSSSRTRPLPVIRSSAGQTLQLSGINLRSSIRTAV
jgi:WD40 repeat protein